MPKLREEQPVFATYPSLRGRTAFDHQSAFPGRIPLRLHP